ncbi:unnamed protein product, partial [Allacma fusca]
FYFLTFTNYLPHGLIFVTADMRSQRDFKFADEEGEDLVNLVIPDYGPGHNIRYTGHFASLSLDGVTILKHAKIIIEWIRSLITEDLHTSGKGNSSYGEILLN